MRIVLRLFGLDVFDLDLTTEAVAEAEPCDLSGGTTESTPVGFVASHELPPDLYVPDRNY